MSQTGHANTRKQLQDPTTRGTYTCYHNDGYKISTTGWPFCKWFSIIIKTKKAEKREYCIRHVCPSVGIRQHMNHSRDYFDTLYGGYQYN